MRAKTYIYILLVAGLTSLSAISLYGQKYPERGIVRSGNKNYRAGNYSEAEVDYLRALEKDSLLYEARFNLGNSFYMQNRYGEAAQLFLQLSQDSTRAANAADCHYNAGNALFKERKFREALEEYKNALRLNPGDTDAKFNLAYTKKMLEQEDQDQQSDGQDKQDKQDQQNQQDKQDGGGKDQEQKQDQQRDDKQKQQQDKGQPEGSDKRNDNAQPQQQPGGMSREQAEQLLQAIQASDEKTREKIDEEKKVQAAGRSAKNW